MTATVTLDIAEVALAAGVGMRRQLSAIYNNRAPRYGNDGRSDWQTHIEGALAEFAVAKYTGRFWSGAHDNLKADDVGRYQVRSTPHPRGRLILHPADLDDRVFVHVVGGNGEYTLMGWLVARDGKREEWWQDPQGSGRPAFFVPNEALRSMSELPT